MMMFILKKLQDTGTVDGVNEEDVSVDITGDPDASSAILDNLDADDDNEEKSDGSETE